MKRVPISLVESPVSLHGKGRKRRSAFLPLLLVFLSALVGALLIVGGIALILFVLS